MSERREWYLGIERAQREAVLSLRIAADRIEEASGEELDALLQIVVPHLEGWRPRFEASAS